MYSYTRSLTWALDGVGGQRHAPAALPPGKTWYPLHRRLGGPPGFGLDGCWISRLPPGFDPRHVQPVASRYIDWAIQTHDRMSVNKNIALARDEIIPVSTSSRAVVRGTCSVNPTSCLTCSRLLRNIWETGPVDIVTRLWAGQSMVRFPVGTLISFSPTTSKPALGSASRHVHWSCCSSFPLASTPSIGINLPSTFVFSSSATALQGFGRQSGRRRSAKLVPTFADRGVSRGQRDGSPRPLISVYWTWIATYFIHVAPQLTSRGWVPLRKSGSAGNRTRDLCICSQKLWPLDHRGGLFNFCYIILIAASEKNSKPAKLQTCCRRVLLGKLIVAQIDQKFVSLFATRRYITAFTRTYPSCFESDESMTLHCVSIIHPSIQRHPCGLFWFSAGWSERFNPSMFHVQSIHLSFIW